MCARGCRGRGCRGEGRWGRSFSGLALRRRSPFNVPAPFLFIDVELGMLFNETPQTPLGKQVRELLMNLLLRPSRLHNLFMTDLGWVEGATVGPQAHAYQIRRAPG